MTVQQPSTPEQVIADYQRLLVASEAVLLHSREQDWEALIEAKVDYVALVEQLKQREQGVVFSPAEQERKLALLQQLLEHDKEIRERLTARREELSQLLGVSQQQRKLNHAYGAAEHR